jgi:pyrimidine operon attenuation protein/uracil phosphoribosyltransferase
MRAARPGFGDAGLRRVAGNRRAPSGNEGLVIIGVRRGASRSRTRYACSARWRVERFRSAPWTSLYRDDAATTLPNPRIGPSAVPVSLEERRRWSMTSCTPGAPSEPLDALMDYGRPRRIELAALVDRGGAAAVQPDYVVRSICCRTDRRGGRRRRGRAVVLPGSSSTPPKSDTARSTPALHRGPDRGTADRILETARAFQVARRPLSPRSSRQDDRESVLEASTRTRTSFELAGSGCPRTS